MNNAHNPEGLRSEVVGNGFRLLDEDETPITNDEAFSIEHGTLHKWHVPGACWLLPWAGRTRDTTYRTKLSRPDLRAARGLPPEKEAQPDYDLYDGASAEDQQGLRFQNSAPAPHTQTAEELAKGAAARGFNQWGMTADKLEAIILTAIQTATAEYSSRSEIYLAELADAKAELETTKRELAESERSCELKKAFIETALEQRDSAFKQLTKALSDLAETKAQLEQATQEIYQLRHACNTWQMKVNRVESELYQMRKERDEEYPCAPPWLNGDVHQWPIKAQRNYFSWLSNQRIHEAANARKERDTALAKLREAEVELDKLRKLREWVIRHGTHRMSCRATMPSSTMPCTCGLSALLEEKS